jgi:TatD DNase family protein
VQRLITVSESAADARAALDLMESRPRICLVAGIHPHNAAKTGADDLSALADLHRGRWRNVAATQRLVAVGETGLDYHYDFATPEQQEQLFRFHLELACEVERPVVIHARRAESVVCDILADYPRLEGRFVFHCFSGGPDLARRILNQGGWLSYTGVVTFKKAGEIADSARMTPRDRILVETDAPFLSPEPIRKRRPCEPAFVAHTARFLAELRGEPYETFAATTSANAEQFFNLPEG